MSDLTIAPTRPPTSARRARVLSEAVVSAYLRDISPPRRTLRPTTVAAAITAPDVAPMASAASAPGPARAPRRPRARTRASQRRSPLTIGTAAAVQALRRP